MAIQAIAQKSNRKDVFYQEENDKKSEAWAILIDSSKSLETVAKDVQESQFAWAKSQRSHSEPQLMGVLLVQREPLHRQRLFRDLWNEDKVKDWRRSPG